MLLRAPRVAGLLGVSPSAVYAGLRKGRLPGYRLNRHWLLVRDELRCCGVVGRGDLSSRSPTGCGASRR